MRHVAPPINRAPRILSHKQDRIGFTLVELLIVITIMLILLGITVAGVNYSRTGDKVSSAARQVQSFLAGARDRAIHANEPRGVRLFIEQNLGGSLAALRTVTTMAYISPGGTWEAPRDSAKIQLERIDGNNDGDYEDPSDFVTIVRGFNNPGWWNLKRRGLLVDGMRIRIPAGPSGNWYPLTTGDATTNPTLDVTQPPPDEQLLLLQIPYADPGDAGQFVAHRDLTYEIELPTRMLAQDPSILPEGVVIDLHGSKVPSIWRPTAATGGVYSGYMDIVFSPRGSVIGDAAGVGVLHFYVCDAEDALYIKEQWVNANSLTAFDAAVAAGTPFIPMDEINPGLSNQSWIASPDIYTVKERRLVSVFSQTGNISVHNVNAYIGADGASPDNNGGFADGIADDPYYFAETGEVAK